MIAPRAISRRPEHAGPCRDSCGFVFGSRRNSSRGEARGEQGERAEGDAAVGEAGDGIHGGEASGSRRWTGQPISLDVRRQASAAARRRPVRAGSGESVTSCRLPAPARWSRGGEPRRPAAHPLHVEHDVGADHVRVVGGRRVPPTGRSSPSARATSTSRPRAIRACPGGRADPAGVHRPGRSGFHARSKSHSPRCSRCRLRA